MSVGVFTRMKRVTFVEKTSGDVGDGTEWPVQVTWDQLAEIYYRIRDAEWSSGTVQVEAQSPAPPGSYAYIYAANAFDRPTALIEENVIDGGNYAQGQRGYSYKLNGMEDITGWSWSNYAGATPDAAYYDADYQSGALDPGDVWRDISDNERGIWHLDWPSTGLTYRCKVKGTAPSYQFSTSWPSITTAELIARLDLTGEVAYVLANPGDSIYAPTTELYLGVIFSFLIKQSATFPNSIDWYLDSRYDAVSTYGGGPSSVDATTVDVSLVLSTSALTFPAYGTFYADGVTLAISSVDPFVLTATDWWPYAKAGGPVWNSGTGAKL